MTTESESVDEIIALTRAANSRRRVRKWMAAGILLTLVFGPYLFYRVSSFTERVKIVRMPSNIADTTFAGSLKLVVWNIAHGRGTAKSNWEENPEVKVSRILEIAGFIRRLNADIVVLNEVDFSATWSGGFDQAEAIARAAGFPFYARQCNLDFGFIYGHWQFGNVILSRFPITDARAIDLPAYRVWEDWLAGRKRGLLCQVDLGKEGIVNVIGLHLEVRGEAIRVKSARYLADLFETLDAPLIVGGDLNTTPGNAPRANLTAEGENAFDVLVEKSGLQPEPLKLHDASQLTFPSWKPSTAIDWILFDPMRFQPANHQVLRTGLSDHLPVFVTLDLQ